MSKVRVIFGSCDAGSQFVEAERLTCRLRRDVYRWVEVECSLLVRNGANIEVPEIWWVLIP